PDSRSDKVMVSRFGVVSAVVLILAPTARANGQQRATYEELQNFSAVLNHIRLNYVDSLTYTELTAAAIRGVLRALDPHSYYVSRAEAERRAALEHGELFTVGISLEEVDGAPTVLSVFRRSPAEHAGLFAGDRLVTLNDTAVAGLDVRTIELRLAGENGSKVRLGLERGPRVEPDSFRVELKRSPFELHSVSIVRMA